MIKNFGVGRIHWHIITNQVGYMPDNDPYVTDMGEEYARKCLADDIAAHLEYLEDRYPDGQTQIVYSADGLSAVVDVSGPDTKYSVGQFFTVESCYNGECMVTCNNCGWDYKAEDGECKCHNCP